MKRKDFQAAIAYQWRSIFYKQKAGIGNHASVNFMNIGNAWSSLERWDSAQLNYDRALRLCILTNDKYRRADIYYNLSESLEAQGKFHEALSYARAYADLRDSLLSEQGEKAVAEMVTKYKTERKEAENRLLKQENDLKELRLGQTRSRNNFLLAGIGMLIVILLLSLLVLRQRTRNNWKLREQSEQISRQNSTLKELNKQLIESEEALNAANEAKDQLLSLIIHDISGPVKSLEHFSLASDRSASVMDPRQMREAISKFSTSSVKLSQLVSNLVTFAMTGKKRLKAHIVDVKMNELIGEVVELYQPQVNEKNITAAIAAHGAQVFPTDPDLMMVVLRNLVSNAVKFSPVGGTIRIIFDEEKKMLQVTNGGVGISSEVVSRIVGEGNVTPSAGTGSERGLGIGLQLVRRAVELLGGKLEINSGDGTVFTVFFA
jgi:signal transduction histidine kinase